MVLAATNVKFEAEKVQLAKMLGINISQLCRDALDTRLKISEGDLEMFQSKLVEIEKQIESLTLEKKIILDQINLLESEDELKIYREGKYQKSRDSYAFMVKKNTVDWQSNRQLLRFKTIEETQDFIYNKLKADGLI